MRLFIFLLLVIPAAEMGILLFSGKTIGVLPTILLVILTGVLGTVLAKRQGLNTIRRVQEQLQFGKLPGNEVLDGICVLVGGVLLLTPGFITDFFGLLLLLPYSRNLVKPLLLKMFQKWLDKNTFTIIR